MIDTETRKAINDAGRDLSLQMPGFFGKISLNFQDGNYVSSNVEQSIRVNAPLKKGARK